MRFERDASGLDLGASLVDFGLADDQRRQKPHDIIAGLHGEHALDCKRFRQGLVRYLAFEPEHEALAAHLLDDAAMLVLEGRETLLEPQAHRRDMIEEAGRKGQYGNYVRIRHPNGYHTAYGHMLRFRKGIVPGAKVRQGEIIGYVGSTGLASGPHLHYEVLINSRFVDPLKIQVPRERKLEGQQLAEFQKERTRIDELRQLAPVMTASK